MQSKQLLVMSSSGGLDSTTQIYKALSDNEDWDIVLLNFDYNQRNTPELIAFKNIVDKLKETFIKQKISVLNIDLNLILESIFDLGKQLRDSNKIEESTDLKYYTPYRNLLFSTICCVVGEHLKISNDYNAIHIGLGIHKHETYKNYWDITPEFASKLQDLFSLNTDCPTHLYAPYTTKTKADIVFDAIKYNVPYKSTWTCYNPKWFEVAGIFEPCCTCESCIERETQGKLHNINDINCYHVEKI